MLRVMKEVCGEAGYDGKVVEAYNSSPWENGAGG